MADFKTIKMACVYLLSIMILCPTSSKAFQITPTSSRFLTEAAVVHHRRHHQHQLFIGLPSQRYYEFQRTATNNDNNDNASNDNNSVEHTSQGKKRKHYHRRKPKSNNSNNGSNKPATTKRPLTTEEKQKLVAKAAQEQLAPRRYRREGNSQNNNKNDKTNNNDNDSLLGTVLNPFKAGKKLRRTLESLTGVVPESTKSIYLLDDRLSSLSDTSGLTLAERNPALDRQADYIPEVLVVGATGEVGRLIVRRLLLEGKVRVKVLVRDLYSSTLNLLGTGVTYCQGNLANYESLEYALTDVDKIIFCAGAPRPDEEDFGQKFQQYLKETLLEEAQEKDKSSSSEGKNNSDQQEEGEDVTDDWRDLDSAMQLRAQLSQQVDCIGMQNLISAYQNVRFADYGLSQTAKRSLFKFGSKNEDFSLFSIQEEENENSVQQQERASTTDKTEINYNESYDDDLELQNYADGDEDDAYYKEMADQYQLTDGEEYTTKSSTLTKTQCLWMKNAFDHAVFVGKVMRGAESAVTSSRLRSRQEPEMGIDLSSGFGGFIVRLCSDGGTYEAFVRTELYESLGIEYVCEFSTETKVAERGKTTRNKFTTVRLGFENFKPVLRRQTGATDNSDSTSVPRFRGKDMRYLGFRYRGDANKMWTDDYSQFYLALNYIKVYRSQPEPEFVYLSDARIPPTVSRGMVRHDQRQIRKNGIAAEGDDESVEESVAVMVDESEIYSALEKDYRSKEETYYKYRGEQILKASGLSYAIVRVAGFNEVSSGEESTIDLSSSDDAPSTVSRADVAQVCTSALLNPDALNKSFYVGKTKRKAKMEEDTLFAKFSQLSVDR